MIRKIKLLIILVVNLFLLSLTNFQSDEFLFQKGNQKLILKIGTGERKLHWNKKTTLGLKYVNIDSKKLNYSAVGISLKKFSHKENIITLNVNPNRSLFKNDTLKLFISARDSNDSIWIHRFNILIVE